MNSKSYIYIGSIVIIFIAIFWFATSVLNSTILLDKNRYIGLIVLDVNMEHGSEFDKWWAQKEAYYARLNISEKVFLKYPFHDGIENRTYFVVQYCQHCLSTGDIVVYKDKEV
jgi:hypothetical protein